MPPANPNERKQGDAPAAAHAERLRCDAEYFGCAILIHEICELRTGLCGDGFGGHWNLQ